MAKRLNDLSSAEIRELKAGEEVHSFGERSSDFVSFYYDSVIILPPHDGRFNISFLLGGFKDVGYNFITVDLPNGEKTFDVGNTIQRFYLSEVAQGSASVSQVLAMATVILEHAKRHTPDAIEPFRQRLEAAIKV